MRTRQQPSDIRLLRDHEPDLLVKQPQLRAEVSSYEEGKLRWSELRLWTSLDGVTIAEQVGVSVNDRERDRFRAWVCPSDQDVIKHLKRGWLARQLYRKAGIDDTEVVL